MTKRPPTTETRIVLRTILSAGVLAVLLFACVGAAAGATWVVDDDGGAGFTSIQAAVDAASEGDTIEVRSGTYVENVEEVKFRGVVTGEPDFGGAVGSGGVNVQIDEIISDPTGNLRIGGVTTVTWPMVPRFADINVTIGDKVEVCGEYRDIGEIPDWWSDVGDHWVSLNTSQQFYHYLKSLESEIRFTGTAIEYFDMNIGGVVGAPWGWIVCVNDVISGPQPCNNQLNVALQAVTPPWGYMDPNITEGDMVEVYGYYYGDQDIRGVSLAGYEEYYIRRLSGPKDRSLVQVEGQPEVYWLQNGRLYWVTDWNVINDMSGVPGWDSVNALPAGEFNPAGYPQGPRFITTGAESDGLLIRWDISYGGDGKVYLIEDGEKRWITSPEAFVDYGHNWEDVIDVTQPILDPW